MLYAFSSAGNLGFSNPIVIGSLIISIIIISIFVRRQLTISTHYLTSMYLKVESFVSVQLHQ